MPGLSSTGAAPSRRAFRARAVEFTSAHFGFLSILVIFATLFIFFSIQADAFLTTGNLLNVGRQIARRPQDATVNTRPEVGQGVRL